MLLRLGCFGAETSGLMSHDTRVYQSLGFKLRGQGCRLEVNCLSFRVCPSEAWQRWIVHEGYPACPRVITWWVARWNGCSGACRSEVTASNHVKLLHESENEIRAPRTTLVLSETARKLDLKSSPAPDIQELRAALGAGTCGKAVVRWRADLRVSGPWGLRG